MTKKGIFRRIGSFLMKKLHFLAHFDPINEKKVLTLSRFLK